MDPRLLEQLEQQYGIQPGLLNAVMMQESGGKADAVSPRGARGWFQFMPETAAQYGVKDPTDFAQSARGAAKYLANLHGQFGNWEDTLRAYNWGQGNVRAHKAGKRKDMPMEAQNYPSAVMARMDAPPELPGTDMDEPPELPDLPPELPSQEADAPKSTVRNWQKELEDYRGTTVLPMVGAGVGGLIGGISTAPTVVGAPAGTVAGGTIGALAGYASAIAPHDAPIEEKLKFLVNKFNMESVMNLAGVKGVQMLSNVLAKTPMERVAIEEWFARQGSKNRPELGPFASRATSVYHRKAADMNVDIDNALGESMRELNAGGSPTEMGEVFQQAYRKVSTKLDVDHETLFAPFRHGTTVGNMKAKPSSEVMQIAKQVQQNFKDIKITEKEAGASASVLKMIDDLAKGVEVPLATLIAQKRAMMNTANWDTVAGSVDNSIRRRLTGALDRAIEAELRSKAPAAYGAWNTANAVATRNLGTMHDEMIVKMASSKMDPMKVTEFVADNASPSAITSYKKALGMLQRNGGITKEQNAFLMDHVRRNWVEKNMNNHKKALEMYESILGSGKNQEAVDAFNAVFQGSPMKSVLEETARAAHKVKLFREAIPNQLGGPGEYVVAPVLGGAIGGAPGAAVATIGVFLTHLVPKMLARSATTQNPALRNKVRFVVSWLNQASPSDLNAVYNKGTLSVMPANVQRAWMELEAENTDE